MAIEDEISEKIAEKYNNITVKLDPRYQFLCDKCGEIGYRENCYIGHEFGYLELCDDCFHVESINFKMYIMH